MANKKKKKEPPKPQYVINPIKNRVRDYHVYRMTKQEKLLYTILAFIVGGIVGLVFYGGLFMKDGEPTSLTAISNTVVFIVVGIVAQRVFLPVMEANLLRKQQKNLRSQFRDMLESITSSLSANNTVVQSFTNAYNDMCMQHTANSYIAKELEQIELAKKNNFDLEIMINDFAKRSGIEDIESFANVFSASYGPGGRMKDVMRQTHDAICDKMQIEDEIAAKMSSNRLELNVITCAPIFIMLLLRVCGGDFRESFASPIGVVVITAAIVMFVFAYRLGQKIINFK